LETLRAAFATLDIDFPDSAAEGSMRITPTERESLNEYDGTIALSDST
jgi:hypothetical protein